jgi:hypothetical protein
VRALEITSPPTKGETMQDKTETIFYALKTLICFAGYVASVLIGQPSEVLATVSAMSAAVCALFAYFQIDWS